MSQEEAAAFGVKELGQKFLDLVTFCNLNLPDCNAKTTAIEKLLLARDKAIKALSE